MSSSSLLRETQRLWAARDGKVSLRQISIATGLTLRWLIHFDRQTSNAPAVDKVEKLYNYLSGKQLTFE